MEVKEIEAELGNVTRLIERLEASISGDSQQEEIQLKEEEARASLQP